MLGSEHGAHAHYDTKLPPVLNKVVLLSYFVILRPHLLPDKYLRLQENELFKGLKAELRSPTISWHKRVSVP